MYRLQIERRAEQGLRRVRHRRVVSAIRAPAEDPRPSGATKLTAFDPPAWRVRVGQYRIGYEVDDDAVRVIVVNVAPRGEVYR